MEIVYYLQNSMPLLLLRGARPFKTFVRSHTLEMSAILVFARFKKETSTHRLSIECAVNMAPAGRRIT